MAARGGARGRRGDGAQAGDHRYRSARATMLVQMDATSSLHTARLRLEPWAPEHGAMLARLAALPEVMRHVGAGTTWTPAEAEERSARVLAHWSAHGFGWRAAVERASGRRVGVIALNVAGPDVPELDDDDHEIGWWIDPAAWRNGYATEGGRAIVDEAFARLGAPSVVARVRPANGASLRVAAALGLEHERDAVDRLGLPIRILRLANPRRGRMADSTAHAPA
jgi:RimJ/RimL family protein N-acetyltransferase